MTRTITEDKAGKKTQTISCNHTSCKATLKFVDVPKSGMWKRLSEKGWRWVTVSEQYCQEHHGKTEAKPKAKNAKVEDKPKSRRKKPVVLGNPLSTE